MKNNLSLLKIMPVMFGYFIMGFVDIIGIATSYVKNDFAYLSDSVVNMLSLSCFFWFLILAIPTGMLMNRIGRKNTVLLSFIFHVMAMSIPLIVYDFRSILVAFAMIGIGNTLLQVSLNPLVTNVVNRERLTGTLTLGQFVKAVSSFVGPLLAAWVAGSVLGWKMIFPIYAVTSLVAFIWLWINPIHESQEKTANISFKDTFNLFRDKYIVAFFVGILVLVGVDVGLNMTFPKFLMERCGLALTDAGMGNSVYFFARTLGAFLGGILLMKYAERKFFIYSVYFALLGLVLMLVTNNLWFILGCVAVFGVGYANLFSIIFSLAMKRVPDQTNQVSALLIVGVSGGAILPPILGVVTDLFGMQAAAIAVIALVWLYMVWLTMRVKAVA